VAVLGELLAQQIVVAEAEAVRLVLLAKLAVQVL